MNFYAADSFEGYAPASSAAGGLPICAPSGAVLLTGKHSFVNGKIVNVLAFNWQQDNFPKLLQANGYRTDMIGKIHMDEISQGFDFFLVLPGQG